MSAPSDVAVRQLIAGNLRRARRDAGLTQQQLADRLELVQHNVSRWETGHVTPRYGAQLRVCETLGIPLAYLYTGHHETSHHGP